MEYKDTTQILTLEDKIEGKAISFDEVRLEDADYIHVKVLEEGSTDSDSDIYLNIDQTKDLIEKLSRFVYNRESSSREVYAETFLMEHN